MEIERLGPAPALRIGNQNGSQDILPPSATTKAEYAPDLPTWYGRELSNNDDGCNVAHKHIMTRKYNLHTASAP